jgi:2,4-dienoyl-CoA reductase-like NADH-dependent reductase (Old Yellow Enzyme family)
MSELFETCTMGNLELRNRFVRSATWEGMATVDGEVTDALVNLYRDLAKGKIGLAILSAASVDPRGKGMPGMIAIDRDDLIPGLARIAGAVHDEDGKIVAQIYHCGSHVNVDAEWSPEAPSAVEDKLSGKMPEVMGADAIARVVEAFAGAAQRTKESGFDGVQLHCAHGYLLSQFLSPYTNVRADNFGGAIENRARFVFDVYEAVRARVGQGYPILLKINVEDFHDGGLSAEDSLWVCEQLDAKGIDAIELSGGTPSAGRNGPIRSKIFEPSKEAYFREHAKRVTARVKCPVVLVGGVRSLEVIEDLYAESVAQFFSMSRPLISEPDLVKRWISGTTRKARCASCNKCFETGFKGRLHCASFARLDGMQAENAQ